MARKPAGGCITLWSRCTAVAGFLLRQEAERLIDEIPAIQPEAYYNKVLRELTEHYDTILKTYNCGELLKLTMSIYAKKQEAETQKRRLGAVDESFLHRAEDLLFSELAAALELDREQVQPYIAARVEAARRSLPQ